MRRFYVSDGAMDFFTNSRMCYHVRDRSYPTSKNVMCNAVTRRDAYIVAAALNAMEEKIPSHNSRVTKRLK